MKIRPQIETVLGAIALCLCVLFGMAGHAQAQGYLLQPGDVVEVTVLEDPSIDRRTLIGPDGRINIPLAGSLQAGGRTVEAVQQAIRANLGGSFVTPPTVTVSLVATAPPALPEPEEEPVLWSVYVLGEVRSPGRFDYDSEDPITVLQALAFAGGPDVFAARKRIQIRRLVNGVETLVHLFDYDALESGKPFAPMGFLEDGDVIVVPERGLFR